MRVKFQNPCFWVIFVLATFGCGKKNTPPSPPPADTLVTVNGTPITQTEVQQEKPPRGHGSDEPDAAVLESLITAELAAQKAVEMGLEADPAYRAEWQKMETQRRAWKRKRLANLYFAKTAPVSATVSDAETRDYFEKNAAAFRADYHILQMFVRIESQINDALKQLEEGKSFEEVARGVYPSAAPTGEKPWDLGYLPWMQTPEQWRPVLAGMKPGDHSEVLRGDGSRFWIFQLVDKKENPEATFEKFKDAIAEKLRAQKLQQSRAGLHSALRQGADIKKR